jgi:thiol-disulfide isomerase/thioredoxin
MRHTIARFVFVAAIIGGCMIFASPVYSADRTADQILKEIDAVKVPTLDSAKSDDLSAVKKHKIKFREASEKRARLISQLYKVAPNHKRIPELMQERWKTVGAQLQGGKYDELVRELENVIAHTKAKDLKIEATYTRAQLKLNPQSTKRAPDASGAEDFFKLAPKDPRVENLLGSAASATRDDKKKAALLERLRSEFPDSDYAGMLQGEHSRTDSIGKRFHLIFDDAISGSSVSISGLRGKVVVIDFWATWCGPCVAEMPKMKELYAKYRDQGVEFVGVSLDRSKEEGGLDSLKDFVKEKGIKWPQYYQGKFWNGDFSKSWGVNSIPCVFVVDTEGKLFSVEARGKLEEMIPELLKKKNGATASAEKTRPDSPDSDAAGMLGMHNRSESIGQRFHLTFEDAISGANVSMAGLRGKVVVIDFWATWCGPCVREMPKMKSLYAKYRSEGVEFIGVSLDQPKEQGGLDKLKKFVKEEGIEWPQFYQGKGWKGDFSKSWGVNSIPCVFVVDTEGKLFSVEARGKLEEMIPELLKKKSPATAGVGG